MPRHSPNALQRLIAKPSCAGMNPTHDVPQRCRRRRPPVRTKAPFAPDRNRGVTFPIHNDEEHDGDRIAVRPMPARAGRSARLCYPLSEMPPLRARAGGGERNRTDDLLLAKQALSRLSYTPCRPAAGMVGLGRLELPTSRLSGVRSNRTELQAPNVVPPRCPVDKPRRNWKRCEGGGAPCL